jgi:hypothetical protein
LGKKLKIISVNLLIFILLLIIAECLLHIIPPFDRFITYYDAGARIRNIGPYKEYTYIGNVVGRISEFKVHIKNNSLGFHDTEHTFLNNANNYRILILGDSQVEAIQVDLPKTFFKILEKKLNNEGFRTEVIALGTSGYGPKDAVDLYVNIGRKYNPDMVIWSFTNNNDVQDSYREFEDRIWKRNLEALPEIPDFLKISKIATYLYTRKWIGENSSAELPDTTFFKGEFSYINEIDNWEQIVFLKHWPPIFVQAWDSLKNYYLELIEKIHNDGKILLTISSTGAYPYFLLDRNKNIEWDFNKPNRLVEEISNENSVNFLPMKSIFDSFIEKNHKDVTFVYDGHLNEAGHRLVAETLYSEIKELLIRRNNNFVPGTN